MQCFPRKIGRRHLASLCLSSVLLDVVNEWVGILNDEQGAAKMAEVKANLYS